MTVVEEHSEPEEFWETLGGKAEYLDHKKLGMSPDFEPRLFDMRFSTGEGGVFWMAEVFNHSQLDLHNDAIMVLDAFSTIYVWVGS